MFIKNKRFFKKRFLKNNKMIFFKKTLYLNLLKFKIFFFKNIFKKFIKISKKFKIKIYFCFKKNLIISKKSKNSRMGKGKGQNKYNIVFSKNTFLKFKKISNMRYFKIKKKLNFFFKNKIK